MTFVYSPTSYISPHFTMGEIGHSDTAERNGIDNTPNAEIVANASLLAINILEKIRSQFGAFSPTSWYRCEQLEKNINATVWKEWCKKHNLPINDTSWSKYFALKSHPKGQAADIKIPGVRNEILHNWIKNNIPEYDQLILEFVNPNVPGSGWVHISYNKGNNRKQQLVIG